MRLLYKTTMGELRVDSIKKVKLRGSKLVCHSIDDVLLVVMYPSQKDVECALLDMAREGFVDAREFSVTMESK